MEEWLKIAWALYLTMSVVMMIVFHFKKFATVMAVMLAVVGVLAMTSELAGSKWKGILINISFTAV